jgi:hypothetical protein
MSDGASCAFARCHDESAVIMNTAANPTVDERARSKPVRGLG